MKTFAAVAIALASVATAQLGDIPSCALNCFVDALGKDGCSSLTDFACHCTKTELIPSVTPCVQAACSADDQAKVITAVEGTCAEAGVPISIPAPSSAAPSSAPASSAQGSAPASSAAGTTAAPAPSSAASVVTSAVVPSGNATAPSTPTVSQFTGGAAQATQAAGLLGAAALALLAM